MLKLYMGTWKNIFNFSGRARRLEYWVFALMPAIICGILGILVSLFPDIFKGIVKFDPETLRDFSKNDLAIYMNLLSLVFVIPFLALSVRRLHDLDKSGWRFLLIFIPIIGGLYLSIISYFFKGTVGSNKYGADPKRDS